MYILYDQATWVIIEIKADSPWNLILSLIARGIDTIVIVFIIVSKELVRRDLVWIGPRIADSIASRRFWNE